MNYQIQYSSYVKDDLIDIKNWYSKINSTLPKHFISEFKSIFDFIKTPPNSFEIRYENVPIAHLNRFPFGIHFELKEEIIIVFGVFHTSRNPKIWKKRN